MNSTGAIIRNLRLKNDLTLEELANNLNIRFGCKLNKGMISKWESDKSEPRFEYAKYLASYFDVTIDYLLGGPKEIENKIEKKITDVKEAMELILSQPGLMLNGEMLSDESKIALANAIKMGLAYAEQKQKKENNKK